MATHSSTLAWRIAGTEEPGALPSKGRLKRFNSSPSNPIQESSTLMTYHFLKAPPITLDTRFQYTSSEGGKDTDLSTKYKKVG